MYGYNSGNHTYAVFRKESKDGGKTRYVAPATVK